MSEHNSLDMHERMKRSVIKGAGIGGAVVGLIHCGFTSAIYPEDKLFNFAVPVLLGALLGSIVGQVMAKSAFNKNLPGLYLVSAAILGGVIAWIVSFVLGFLLALMQFFSM